MSLHIVASVGYSIEYYDARNNKYKIKLWLMGLDKSRSLQNKGEYMRRIAISLFFMLLPA